MQYRSCVVRPTFLWVDGRFEANFGIRIDENGNIDDVGVDVQPKGAGDAVFELSDQALIPGFVNSHSHAFHRHLRGKSEIGKMAKNNFWKWRDNMYGLVENIDYQTLKQFCLETFREMLSAGITTVGEFHYVHHGEGRFDLDKAVLEAAEEAGIRIVLIQTLYQRAGFDSPELHPVQKRFVSEYEEFVAHLDVLESVKQPTATIAVAAHSSRAVGFETMHKLYDMSVQRNMAFHIHLEEQPKEIEDCKHHLNTTKSPSDIILERINPGKLFTGVHNTYTSLENQQRFSANGANVSVCPCTEGYLGDGIPNIDENTLLSFGTDCNNRLCFLEEMRWAAYTQQMKANSRNVSGLSAEKLFHFATIGGARSLNIEENVGSFETGKAFDFVSFSLDNIVLQKESAETLMDAIVFSAGNREIKSVGVQGKVSWPSQ